MLRFLRTQKEETSDADLLARYGLMAKKLIVFEPAPQEISDLRSLLNRLDVLEKNPRRELNRQEKTGKRLTFHRLEQQSITRPIKRLGLHCIPNRTCNSSR